MSMVRERGLDKKTCIVASVAVADSAGVQGAVDTIAHVSKVEGVRGVHIMAGDDFALAAEVIKTSGLSRS
jgi:hypothetical protein